MEPEKKENEAQEKEQEKEIKIPLEEFEKCKKEREEYLEGWKRAKADLINYKKEEEQRFKEFANFNLSLLMKDLITVLDSFDLGLAVLKEDDPAKKGMILIRSKLVDILKNFGLSEILVTIGEDFDPSKHEAVGEVESEVPAGMIAEEVERGYLLNNKVIRPVKVRISKGHQKK